MFCWHKWGMWEDIAKKKYVNSITEEYMYGVLIQHRRCKKCNALSVKETPTEYT